MTPRHSSACGAGLGIDASRLLVNVKRLHPLAGQRYLIEALPAVLRAHPGARLVICGTGDLLPELQAVARAARVDQHVTFAGLVENAAVARLLRRRRRLRAALDSGSAADRRGGGARRGNAGGVGR